MRIAIFEALRELINSRMPRPSLTSSQDQPETKRERLKGTITSLLAARKMEAYINAKGMTQTEFAIQAQTTDRTLRSFRKTGNVRKSILDSIAKAMGKTREELLQPD